MTFEYNPPMQPLEVIFEDKDVLGVVKPSGLLSVPGRGADKQDSLYTRVLEQYPLAQMVHRLDMDTSGIVVVALRRKAERALKAQFQARTIQKTYQAVVSGIPSLKSGSIQAPLMAHPSLTLRHVVNGAGKSSQTDYESVWNRTEYSLLNIFPRTGRSHQIRVHLEHIGHPILGDRFYASDEIIAKATRLMLHAQSISFEQPYSREVIRLDTYWEPEKYLLT